MAEYYKGSTHIFTNRSNGIVTIKAGQGEYLPLGGTTADLNINYTIPNGYLSFGTHITIANTGSNFGTDIAYDSSTGRIHIMDLSVIDEGGGFISSLGADLIFNSAYSLVAKVTTPGNSCGFHNDSIVWGSNTGFISCFNDANRNSDATYYITGTNPVIQYDVSGIGGHRMDANTNNNIIRFNRDSTFFNLYYNTTFILSTSSTNTSKAVLINNTFYSYVDGTNSFLPFYKTSSPTVLDSKMYFGQNVSNAKMNDNLLVVIFDIDGSLRQKVSIYDVSSNNTSSFVRKANLYIQHSTSTASSKRDIRKIVITTNLIVLQQGSNVYTSNGYSPYDIGNRQFFLINGLNGWVVDNSTGSNNGFSANIINNEILIGDPNANVVRRIPYTISTNPNGSYSSTYVTATSEGLNFFSTGYITFEQNLIMNSYFSNYTFVENFTADSVVLSDTTSDIGNLNLTNLTCTNLTSTNVSLINLTCTNMRVTSANISTISNNFTISGSLTTTNLTTTNLTLSGLLNVTGYVSASMPFSRLTFVSSQSVTAGQVINFSALSTSSGVSYSNGIFTITSTGFYSLKCNINVSTSCILTTYVNNVSTLNYMPSTNISNNSFLYLTSGDIVDYRLSASVTLSLIEVLIIKMF